MPKPRLIAKVPPARHDELVVNGLPLSGVGVIIDLRLRSGGSSVFLWFRFVLVPRCSMYGMFTYIWVIFRANVGKYSIHGAYGVGYKALFPCSPLDPLKLL